MSKQSLPVVDPARTEFGFCRTQCDCLECTRSCHHIPGYLVPADLERMHQHLAPDQNLHAWAKQQLLASPGALVLRHDQMARIHTVVPARRLDGACIFLTESGQCAIHAVSPFGCAFFDSHMRHQEADRRSIRGLQAIIDAWNAGEPYARVWVFLAGNGLVAPSPEVARQQLKRAGDDKHLR
jgi:Putative zinc- or iron-chelating domain